jgi:release factor glutamine methyltransferase
MPEDKKIFTIASILSLTTDFFTKKGLSSPRLDAELLLSKVLNLERMRLYVNFERMMSQAELDEYRELVRRRSKFEPAAFILGEKEFYSLPFKVSPSVLIPRPETELLVDEAISHAKESFPDIKELMIADVGCGSGAIAVALAKNLPNSKVIASDISKDALEIAKENANTLGAHNIEFYLADLTQNPFPQELFHIITANLPYVSSSDMDSLPPDVKDFEPRGALDGGKEGLSLYERFLPLAAQRLAPGGIILTEHHPPQFPAMEKLALSLGLTLLPRVRDLSKQDRIFAASKPKGDS